MFTFTIDISMEQFTYSKVTKGDGSQISKKSCIFLIIFTFATLCMFISGIVLLAKQAGREVEIKEGKLTTVIDLDNYCEPSEEAKRIKLDTFLEKCQLLYLKIHPSAEYYKDTDSYHLDKIARK